MQDEFLVHTREGEECPRCGGTIRRIVVGGRSTYFCPDCQMRLRRRRKKAAKAMSELAGAAGGLPDRPLDGRGGTDGLHGRDRAGGDARWGGRARWRAGNARDGRGGPVRGDGPGERGDVRRRECLWAGGRGRGDALAGGARHRLSDAGGVVPIVPAAIVYDLAEGDASARPTADAGYAACEAAREGVPERGQRRRGDGDGGRQDARARVRRRRPESATRRRAGASARRSPRSPWRIRSATSSAADGSSLRGRGRGAPRTVDFIAALDGAPTRPGARGAQNTTLVCVMTDAPLDKAGCARVARAASAGIARAVEPVFTDVDGDVVFCLASVTASRSGRFEVLQLEALAARVTAEAIRDAVLALLEGVRHRSVGRPLRSAA